MEFLYVYLGLLTYFVIWFVIAQIKKNNGLIDIAWGMSFIVTAVISLLLSGTYNIIKITLLAVVVIWGLRLSIYLFRRNWKKDEDFRYKAMRQKWKNHPRLTAFFRVFVEQSIFSYVIGLPLIFTNLYVNDTVELTNMIVLILGVIVFLLGFTFEVLADHSLARFKKDPKNKGKIMTSGVWSLTRHPNYFGEATLWWGIGIIAISGLVPILFVGLLSPVIITLLLRFVSGVPLLEKRYKGNPDYEVYKEKVPIFIPFIK